jgi:glutamate-1-semialdehyde 2,1-aminomutase
MTGLRLGPAGYQSLTSVKPDLTTLGKIVGGGLPLAAYGGRGELMDQVSPAGPVYQAGTLSGNPLAVAAGMATLDLLEGEGPYTRLEESSAYLADGIQRALRGRPGCVQRVGSMLTLFFGPPVVRNYEDAKTCDTMKFGRFFAALIDAGVWIPPSQFEAWFVSLAHTREDLDVTIEAIARAIAASD